MLYKYNLEKIKLGNEKNDFLNYLEKMLKKLYKENLIYSDKIIYQGKPSLVIQLGKKDKIHVEVLIIAHKTLHVNVIPLKKVDKDTVQKIVDVIETLAQAYRRKSAIYYIYVQGEKIRPSKFKLVIGKFTDLAFSNNMALLFAFSMVLFSIIYSFLGSIYTPPIVLFILFAFQFFSYKIPSIVCDWSISSARKNVFIVGFFMSLEEYNRLLKKGLLKSSEIIYELKESIYNLVIKEKKRDIVKVLSDLYNVALNEDNILIRKMNLFNSVKEISSKMNMFPPRVFLKKSLDLDAAALGFYRSFTALMLTAGLLIELNEEEIKAVLAHEISHIKHKDALILYLLTALSYLIQIYLFYVKIPILLALIVRITTILVFLTIFFFVAKVIEIRADLDAAIIANSLNLASALEKITSTRTDETRIRLRDWILWTPHPPLNYRIHLLRKQLIEKSGWIRAFEYCLKGLIGSIV